MSGLLGVVFWVSILGLATLTLPYFLALGACLLGSAAGCEVVR